MCVLGVHELLKVEKERSTKFKPLWKVLKWPHGIIDSYKTILKAERREAAHPQSPAIYVLAPSVVPACYLEITIGLPGSMF